MNTFMAKLWGQALLADYAPNQCLDPHFRFVAPLHQGAAAVVGHEDAGGRKEYSSGAGTADLRGVDPHFFHFSGTEKSRIDNPARQRNHPAQKLPVFHPDTHIHPHYPWSHRFLPGGVAGVFGQFRISNGWCRYLLSGSWQTCPAGFPEEWLWLAAPDGSRAVYPGNRYAAARLFSVQ